MKKIPKFGTQNALFGNFSATNLTIVTFEIFQIEKYLEKMKMPKFETKNTLFRYFRLKIGNNIVMIEISNFEFVKLQNFVKK